MKELIKLDLTVPNELNNYRLDVALHSLCPQYSRAIWQNLIKTEQVFLDDKVAKCKDKIKENQHLTVNAFVNKITNEDLNKPQKIKLDIIYEDNDILIINKHAGLVTHPGAGNIDKTILNALLYYDENLKNVPRAGIIHRLDKDTSGILIIAKNLKAQTFLVKEMQKHHIQKEYETICHGEIIAGSTIHTKIGKDPQNRLKQKVMDLNGREAITHYFVLDRFINFTHLKVILETGRTHQIRVHLSYIGHPIVGDALYGKTNFPTRNLPEKLVELLKQQKGQLLHAKKITFIHPTTKKEVSFEAPLPLNFQKILKLMPR